MPRRKKGFKATPMDFLILLIALVVTNLPDSFISGLHMGFIAAKLIVLYFGFEVLTGELRGELSKIALGLLAALTLLTELFSIIERYGVLLDIDKASARKRADELVGWGVGSADAAHLALPRPKTPSLILVTISC
jgi:hypothetical protein